MYKRGAAYPENLWKSVGLSSKTEQVDLPFSFVRNPKVKSGEEWWRVVRHSSPLATPVFIGGSADLVKSEE